MSNKKHSPVHFPLPGLSLKEARVLRKCVLMTKSPDDSPSALHGINHVPDFTTKEVAKMFKLTQQEALGLLNRLEEYGLLTKRRRLSGGSNGNGYDGSLHSAILVTAKGHDLVKKYSQ